MPTLEEWEQALATPRRVIVESSPKLLGEIAQRHQRKDAWRQQRGRPVPGRKDNLVAVAAFAPQRELEIVPAVLLHRLGVVTTPAIENLADICSTWAYLRYLWSFDIPAQNTVNPPLRLSEAARNIDFHQKGLLSDQIGVGMAAVLLGTYLSAPLAADVSVAMDDPAWPIDLQYETSPDYLFFDAAQSQLFIVECKGTQTSRSLSVEQLRRGTEQGPSLTFSDGRKPPAIVVATCLSKRGTRILIVDPPGDEDTPKQSVERPRRVGPREWRIESGRDFDRATRLISEAKILSFAGANDVAANKLERAHAHWRPTVRTVPREPVVTENKFGTFRGVRERVGLRDRLNVDVFQGLSVPIYDAMVSGDAARATEALRLFNPGPGASTTDDHTPVVLTTHEKDVLVVKSVAPDGSLLEIRVSP
jgi:hypothetical protein